MLLNIYFTILLLFVTNDNDVVYLEILCCIKNYKLTMFFLSMHIIIMNS